MSSSTIVYGLYQGLLLPHRLGGLSRGREWWVEGPFLKTRKALHRTILSAGKFVNGEVNGPDNKFGVAMGPSSFAEMIEYFCEGQRLIAVIEDGSSQSPDGICGRETYTLSKMGMSSMTSFARWEKVCESLEDIQEALDFGAKAFVINPMERPETDEWNPVFPVAVEDVDAPPVLPEDLRKGLQWLVGTSNTLNDTHRYVPQALWEVTPMCEAVLLFHMDRDEDCLAVYSEEAMDWDERMNGLPSIDSGECFWIPCTVPTMQLRWKRALYEACDNWEGECPAELRSLVPVQVVQIEEVIEIPDADSTEDSEDGSEESSEDSSDD